MSEDAHLALLSGGFDAYRARIQTPLVSSSYITKCQVAFQDALQAHWDTPGYDIAIAMRGSSETEIEVETEVLSNGNGDMAMARVEPVEVVDKALFSCVHDGILLDFPAVRLVE